MIAGSTETVSVRMVNMSPTIWTEVGDYRLGSREPRDNYIWGLSRVQLPVVIVGAYKSVEFVFEITAPEAPGNYSSKWQMVRDWHPDTGDAGEWFGSVCGADIIEVLPRYKGNTPPVLSTVGDRTLREDSPTGAVFVDLRGYAYDAETTDNDLVFRLDQSAQNIIDCYIKDNYYFTCAAPENAGYNDIMLFVYDSEGEFAYENVRVTVERMPVPANTPPVFSTVNDRTVKENAAAESIFVDLRGYAYDAETSDNDLVFWLEQGSEEVIKCYIKDNYYFTCAAPESTGYNDIMLFVYDSEGEFAHENVRVTVEPYTTNTAPSIANLPDVEIEENAGYSSELIDLWRSSYTHDDKKANDDLYYFIDEESNEDVVDCRITGNRWFECYAPERTGVSYVTIGVDDGDGHKDYDMLRVEVVEESDDYPYCSDISVNVRDFSLGEGETAYRTFSLENNSGSRFYINRLAVEETSSYLSVTKMNTPSVVNTDSEASFKLKITAKDTSSDKKVRVKVSAEGRFSSGRRCTATKYFYVSIGDEEEEEDIKLTLGSPAITMRDYLVRETAVRVKNNSGSRICVDLEAVPSSSYVSAELDKERLCVNDGKTGTAFLNVSAEKAGNYTVKVTADYSGGYETALLALKVEKPKEEKPGRMEIISYPQRIELPANEKTEIEVVVVNSTGRDVGLITVGFASLPDGVTYTSERKVSKDGSIITIKAELENLSAEAGVYNVLVKAQYEGKSITRMTELEIPEDAIGITALTPLFLLGNSVTTTLLFLVVVLLAAILILYYYNRKQEEDN
jgi:hypothetical protein